MRSAPWFLAGTLILAATLGAPRTGGTAPSARQPSTEASAAAPGVLLLATQPGALHTSLYLVSPGDRAPLAPLSTFTHLPGATVRAAVLPGTSTVVATADTAETRDPSFDASLFRVAPHTPPERLCDGVVHASRPLVTPEGRVFVSRGAPGPEPLTARLSDMRVDALSIEEVDPSTGALWTVHTTSGHLAFLAGWFDGEVIVYRISPGGADIVGVNPDTGTVRPVVTSLPPFARDFSVDAATGTLVFQGRHETNSRVWTVEKVSLVTGERARLHESASMSLIPFALPGGEVAWNPEGTEGLRIPGREAARRPLGEGADWVLATSEDGEFVAGLHTVPGTLPVPFVLDTLSGRGTPLRAPDGARIAVAGFAPAGGGAL
jgi:hypothetical protein